MNSLPDALRDILPAAGRTAFYGPGVPVFESTPVVSLGTFYSNRSAFEDPEGRARPEEFRYPVQPPPDVTVLVSGFRERPGVRIISSLRDEEFLALTDGAIAAPVGVLRDAAVHGPRLRHPLVVFTGPRHGTFTAADRAAFTKAFGVPAFEQFLGPSGEVLADECEVHHGLHIRAEAAFFETVAGHLVVTPLTRNRHVVLRLATGFSAQIAASGCPCGRSGRKLLDLAPYGYQK